MDAPLNPEQQVYQSLKCAILEQRLPPGTRLREVQLAGLFGVKRGTVRTVLTRLAQDRLVQQRPNAGARVACPDAQEARDLFATRRILEGAVVRQLAGRLDPPALNALRRLLAEEERAYRDNRSTDGLRLSIRFHSELARLTGNSVLQDFIGDILIRTPLVLLTAGPAPRSCVNHDHAAIIDALEQGDAEAAQRLMDEHLDALEHSFARIGSQETPDLEQALATDIEAFHAQD